MAGFILALDEGTTATTAMVVDDSLRVLGKASREITQIYPQPGWVEHDPDHIWAATCEAAREAIVRAGVPPTACQAIGITNQRETTILWDRATGRILGPAIVWQCRRSMDICAQLRAGELEPTFRERTGLVLDPYFSGTKLTWLLRRSPDIAARARDGQVCFGTVDSFLIHRLTGGLVHATDVSNASRTLMLNLRTLAFDPELADALEVPMAMLPRVLPSAGTFGTTRGLDFLPDGIPVSGVAGDQQSALFGQTCFDPGQLKCTYGTGAFILVNTGARPVVSHSGLLTTVAWRIGDQTAYALEGSAFIAGAAVQWLRDGLKAIRTAPEIEALAASVPDDGGVVFVPALAGLGAPHWVPEARGAFLGLSRSTTAGHMARALLEGVALQIATLADAMGHDMDHPINEVRVDGGASANDLLMQFQADVLNRPVLRPANVDTTALGAAMLAGIGVGLWNQDALRRLATIERRFEPGMPAETRTRHRSRFDAAVALVSGFGS